MRYYLEYLNGIKHINNPVPSPQAGYSKTGPHWMENTGQYGQAQWAAYNMAHAEHCNLKMKQMVSSCVTFQLLPVNYPLFKIFTRKISFLWLLIIKYEEFCCKLQ